MTILTCNPPSVRIFEIMLAVGMISVAVLSWKRANQTKPFPIKGFSPSGDNARLFVKIVAVAILCLGGVVMASALLHLDC